jgi:hypothetical protein
MTPTGRLLIVALSWEEAVERVTRIELALSAWESDRSWPMKPLSSPVWRPAVAVIDRLSPWLIARRSPAYGEQPARAPLTRWL